jgi:hypothetical protein
MYKVGPGKEISECKIDLSFFIKRCSNYIILEGTKISKTD